MFTRGFVGDQWWGLSAKDVIEVGLWDRSENLIGWNVLYQSKSYDTVTISYYNSINNPVTYSYQELKPDFILHQTANLLVDPSHQVSSSFQITSGSYIITYNMTREMAGSPSTPLVIKDIASSQLEVKLRPLSSFDTSYTAFCQHKFLMNDVAPLYVSALKNCSYGNIYENIGSNYSNEIASIKALFFIPSDSGMLTFFQNLYQDLLFYTPTPGNSADNPGKNLVRVQGIQTYFNNYLLSNSTTGVSFDDLDNQFHAFVSASVERKFSSAGTNPAQNYVNAKEFVYKFFTQYFYDPISQGFRSAYNNKYFGYFKNALNVGNNRLLPILSIGYMDERSVPTDPLTLLVKLKDPLPNDLQKQSQCWVSNISLTPQIVSAIITSNGSPSMFQIGPPNFSIPIFNASLTNTNTSYTANDLVVDDNSQRQITVSQNITELSVDYTNFSNFILFSSAEMRLKIFKNKVISLYNLSSSVDTLNMTANTFLVASGSVYPYYTQEYTSIQSQMNSVINTFDGYESYLYNQGYYTYQNGTFISASYIADQDSAAIEYDTDNRDSLINTCPEHVLTNADNDEYIIFLSMVGHFFDNIYIYIANMPSERKVGNDATSRFTRRVVDYMLEAFGWNLDNSIEQTDLLNNYLTDQQLGGLNSMSAEERMKEIRNRILQNLPAIYKSKGTDEAIQLILACYGIPPVLLNIREYGGVNYDDPAASYTLYERVYMRQWNTSSRYDSYDLQFPTGSHTYLCKMCITSSAPYTYGKEQVLFGRVQDSSRTSLSGSGEWALGFVRIPKENTGQVFFRIGYKGQETFKMYSPEFPLFDGNIYSVMLRRNYPDPSFEFTPNADLIPAMYDIFVKRNQFGQQVVALSSSAVCYDMESNIRFGQGGLLKIGGWFADWNGQGFTGAFDKFQIWQNPIANKDLEDYTNNFNAYASHGSGSLAFEELSFRMHTDYPFDQAKTGTWRNGNPYFALSSSAKLNVLQGEPNCNMDYMVSTLPWSGSTEIVNGPCGLVSQSVYPWQWTAIDYPSTWGISQYGPNKFRNEKIKYTTQSLQVRLDNLNRSTYVNKAAIAPDSNQIGFYADPQDFKNRDIVRYFGDFDFMDVIGDPALQYSESYDDLRLYRKEFAADRNEYSGSRTLFNELLTTYKLYFNRSVFESIKNVIPTRTNAVIGIVIEPTILERPKYQLKAINSVATYAYEAQITNSTVTISSQLVPSQSIRLSATGVSNPNRDYPVNYGGNNIQDLSDQIEFGHFAGGVPARLIDFSACPLAGYAPLAVQFINQSYGAATYLWDYGDNSTDWTPAEDSVTGDVNPIHVYATPGTYTVTLMGYYGQYGLSKSKLGYITVNEYGMSVDFDAEPKTGTAPLMVNFTNYSVNGTTYQWQFGSGSATSTDQSPAFVYNDPGSYTVSLIAYTQLSQSGGCCSSSISNYSANHISTSYINVLAVPSNCSGPYSNSMGGGQSGKMSFFNQYVYSLGSLTTPVTFSYNAGQSASRYIVSIGGVTQYDSLWVCTPTPTQTMVNTINNALRPYGVNPTPSLLSASLSNITVARNNTQMFFNKTSTNSLTTVQVYNPFNTSCSFTMSCPTPVPPPYIAPPMAVTYSCGTTIKGTSDASGMPYPYVFAVKFTNSDDDLTISYKSNNPIRVKFYYSGSPQTTMTQFGKAVAYDGWNIGDSGYRWPSTSTSQQSALNTALATLGQSPVTINTVTTGYTSTGLGSNMSVSFTNLFSFLEKQFFGGSSIGKTLNGKCLRVEVYAPIPGTVYTISPTCPF
jgi:PKD repeat protein